MVQIYLPIIITMELLKKKNVQKTLKVVIKKLAWRRTKCGERGSNTRPSDLQSDALPTELSPLFTLCNEILIMSKTV